MKLMPTLISVTICSLIFFICNLETVYVARPGSPNQCSCGVLHWYLCQKVHFSWFFEFRVVIMAWMRDSVMTWQCKIWNASRICVSSLRRGHANLLCIVPILIYVLPEQARQYGRMALIYNRFTLDANKTCGRYVWPGHPPHTWQPSPLLLSS